jgi:hypothetical protein
MSVPLRPPLDSRKPAAERRCYTKEAALRGIEKYGVFVFPVCPALRTLWDEGGPKIDFQGVTTTSDMDCIGRILIVCHYLLRLTPSTRSLALFAHRTNLLEDCLDLIRRDLASLPKRLERDYPESSKGCKKLVEDLEAAEVYFRMSRATGLFLLPRCYGRLPDEGLPALQDFLGAGAGALALGRTDALPGFENVPFPPNKPLPEVECTAEEFWAWQQQEARTQTTANQLTMTSEGPLGLDQSFHLVNYYPAWAIVTAGRLADELVAVAESLSGRMLVGAAAGGSPENDEVGGTFGFKAGAERIKRMKAHEAFPADGAGETPPYVEIDLAARTLTIGVDTITPSDKVWEFLKGLADAKQHYLPDLKPAAWKTAVDMLRKKISKENLQFVVEFSAHAYKLARNVRLKNGGQMGIHKTKQRR